MQCFEAKKNLVDSIDGTLSSVESQDFAQHLKTCSKCESERSRTSALLGILRQQARSDLPIDLRQDPIGNSLPKLIKQNSPRKIWKSLPVGVRLLIEGITIACVVMLGIHLGPRLRTLYEEQMDARLQKLIADEDGSTEAVPLSRNKLGGETDGASEADSESDEGSEVLVTEGDESDVRVGRGEIWRFNIKTDSPALVRSQIIKAFRELNIPADTPGFGGLEAPGGIQFDLIVPTSAIPPLKSTLEKLSGPKTQDLPFSETFTWYKNRSKKPIPNGTARIVIWLSQI